MLIESQILIYDFVWAMSEAIDLISPALQGHHKQVTYIAGTIALEMGLSHNETQDIILAAMLHDIGAFSMEEWNMLLSFEASGVDLDRHAFLGYKLLKDFDPLAKAADLIRYHHANFCQSIPTVPVGSLVIHLANEVSFLIDEHSEILKQIPQILANLTQKRSLFHPDAIAAFERLAKKEWFWIEASSLSLLRADMLKRVHLSKEFIDLATLRDFAKVVAQIIDFRSRFTATHSSGVAAVAMELSLLSGFSEKECKMMEIAGFLHDLGKLAVPNEILEKNGALSAAEVNVIRKHTYYTYAILSKLRGLEHIAVWAAQHHERLDGSGYPFHAKGGEFSKLSRIMAVADVVTALTEDRPYRPGMNREEAETVLRDMVNTNELDGDIVALASKNFLYINDVRTKAQQEAWMHYEAFYDSIRIQANFAS
ncbi:MAG: HD domain-containing protein [Clostridia bacterium]|nr:HD domain-containing protein [Clostridia bacterium]